MPGEHDPAVEPLHHFPHRQLLGWIYLGVGLIGVIGVLSIPLSNPFPGDLRGRGDFGPLLLLILAYLFLPFSLLWFWAGYALLRNKRAARPLTIVLSLSLILGVSGIGLILAPQIPGFGGKGPALLLLVLDPLLSLALYWNLRLFPTGVAAPIFVYVFTLESLVSLALGIYGFVVARRILSPPAHSGVEINR